MSWAKRIMIAAIALAVAGGIVGYYAAIGHFDKVEAAVEIGGMMPDLALKDTAGTEHTLKQYQGKIVVLNFCSHDCPYSRGADALLSDWANKYKEKGVVFLGVDSHYQHTAEQVGQYAKDKVSYPILMDAGSKYAKEVGAKRTPEIFVVDKDGKLAYHGAVDNRRGTDEAGDEPYLSKAVDALLGGSAPDPSQTKALGCTIKFAEEG